MSRRSVDRHGSRIGPPIHDNRSDEGSGFFKDAPRGVEKRSQNPASWEACNHDTLVDLLALVTDSGGAIMFSVTSDGGALALSFFVGDDRQRDYINPGDKADDVLSDWILYFDRKTGRSSGRPE